MKLEELLNNPKLVKKLTRKILYIITFTVLLIFALFNLDRVWGIIQFIFALITPLLLGIGVAFVLNVLVKLFEERIFKPLDKYQNRIWAKLKRPVSIVISFVLLVAILTFIILFIIPEIAESVRVLTDTLPARINEFGAQIMTWLSQWGITKEYIDSLNINWSAILTQISQFSGDIVGSLFNVTISMVNGVVAFVMSIIFSVYMLYGKEKLIRNIKRTMYAVLPRAKAKRIIDIGSLSNRVFSGFVGGQLTEALIMGCLCYIGMSIFQFPYALLISSILALTALIPIIGAFIGAGIGGFILLLIDPMYCIWFIVFIIVLQQIEGNLIYPRVVGTSIGLPGLWVMIAIMICSNLMGIVGVLIGVPLFSVLYTLWRQNVSKRLKNRGITEEVVMQPPEDLDPGKARIRKPKMFRIKKEKKAKETVPEQVSAGEEPKSQEKPE